MPPNLSNEPVRAVPKPTYSRTKKTAAQRGHISAKVRQRVHIRSGGRCEWCGWAPGEYDATGRRMGLQDAHLVRRWKLPETTENDVARLCGPSTNAGTCHWKVDYTAAGREWAEAFRKKLYQNEMEE